MGRSNDWGYHGNWQSDPYMSYNSLELEESHWKLVGKRLEFFLNRFGHMSWTHDHSSGWAALSSEQKLERWASFFRFHSSAYHFESYQWMPRLELEHHHRWLTWIMSFEIYSRFYIAEKPSNSSSHIYEGMPTFAPPSSRFLYLYNDDHYYPQQSLFSFNRMLAANFWVLLKFPVLFDAAIPPLSL